MFSHGVYILRFHFRYYNTYFGGPLSIRTTNGAMTVRLWPITGVPARVLYRTLSHGSRYTSSVYPPRQSNRKRLMAFLFNSYIKSLYIKAGENASTWHAMHHSLFLSSRYRSTTIHPISPRPFANSTPFPVCRLPFVSSRRNKARWANSFSPS